MGMRASITLISPQTYSAIVKDPQNADVSLEGESYDIDKAWSEFHEVFKTLGAPLKYAIEGEFCPNGNFEENDTGGNDGFVSVALAARISKELAKLPFKKVSDGVRESWRQNELDYPDDEDEYLGCHYATLQKAYAAAADQKMAVYIGIS
jgi:Domain of unknown function (DUF1877)